MKNDLLLNCALERILDLEETWQKQRKHTRIIVGHTYAQNLQIIRDRGDAEINELLNLMLLGMPAELRRFIDSYYPTLCLPVEDFIIGADFNFSEFFRLESMKRKKRFLNFGKMRATAYRAMKPKKKIMLNTAIKLLNNIGFKIVIEEIPMHQISLKT